MKEHKLKENKFEIITIDDLKEFAFENEHTEYSNGYLAKCMYKGITFKFDGISHKINSVDVCIHNTRPMRMSIDEVVVLNKELRLTFLIPKGVAEHLFEQLPS